MWLSARTGPGMTEVSGVGCVWHDEGSLDSLLSKLGWMNVFQHELYSEIIHVQDVQVLA